MTARCADIRCPRLLGGGCRLIAPGVPDQIELAFLKRALNHPFGLGETALFVIKATKDEERDMRASTRPRAD